MATTDGGSDRPPPPADCLPCRVTGVAVCGGAAASLLWRAGERGVAHAGVLRVAGAAFAALAVARAAM